MKCFYKGLEDFIPNGMTVVIIDFLEEINVKHRLNKIHLILSDFSILSCKAPVSLMTIGIVECL